MRFLVRSKSSSELCLMEEDGYRLKALYNVPVDMALQGYFGRV